jgi:lipid A 3-O-deacylase
MGDHGPASSRNRRFVGKGIVRAVLTVLLALLMQPASAVDGVSISAGPDDSTNASVDLYRFGVQWNWKKRWLQTENWHLGGYWDLQGGYWDNTSRDRTNSGLWELAFTPVFRVQQNELSGFAPFVEFGVGAHLLSKTSVSDERQFSTSFQFGSLVGIGARFGNKDAFEISYRYQHLSNASIKHPNNGINFNILRVGYWF